MKKETALLIWFAFTVGILDGLFGIDTVRYKIFPVEYQSFWGAFFSLYFIIGIFLIYGKKIIKDKLKLIQVISTALAVYGFAELIYRLDAVRLQFITLSMLLGMEYEFSDFFGHTINFSFMQIILLQIILIVVAILIEFYKRKVKKQK